MATKISPIVLHLMPTSGMQKQLKYKKERWAIYQNRAIEKRDKEGVARAREIEANNPLAKLAHTIVARAYIGNKLIFLIA